MSYKSICFFLILTCLMGPELYGQQKTLRINVKNADLSPLPGATVLVRYTGDSSRFFASTNSDGLAVFNKFKAGLNNLSISYVGYRNVDTLLRIPSTGKSFEIVMLPEATDIEGIDIIARRPLIRQEDDKTIIDPHPIANIATNAQEVLESTPGLYVDQEGGIFLTGSTPAAIYINGREMKMSNQDIMSILRSIPPGSIDKIEILRTPSSRFDAASSGGIVNIILKKGVKIGRFGSLSVGMNQGRYGNRFAGFSCNNSGNKTTGYVNANYSRHDQLETLNSKRFLLQDTAIGQAALTRITSPQLFSGFGLNYEASPSISISYDGRINAGRRNSEATNKNNLIAGAEVLTGESVNQTSTVWWPLNIQQDLGMILKIDTSGSEWNSRISYNFNHNSYDQEYLHVFSNQASTLDVSGLGDNLQKRHFLVVQSDLTWLLPLKLKAETGIKSSWQHFDSDTDFSLWNDSVLSPDPARTNRFGYQENINAAYLQASRPLPAGFILKAGIRMENTSMNGHQRIPSDTSFLTSRFDLFPYVYLSRRLFNIMGAELFGYLIFRKTINRPGYQDLNPAVRFVDNLMYETGNPSLKPQFTENYEVNISFNDMPVFAVGRKYTYDIYSQVMYKDASHPEVLVRTYDNVGTNKEIYFRGLIGIPPGGKYFFALGTQYNYNEYNGFYDSQPWYYNRGSWRFFTFHSLNLFSETKLTVNGFLMTKGQWNFYEMKNFGQLNLGLTQTLLDKKLTISLHASDVFKTMVTRFEFNQGGIVSSGDRYSDNRRIGINIRYNFGIRKKDPKQLLPSFEEPEI